MLLQSSSCLFIILEIHYIYLEYLQFLSGKPQGLVVVMNGQMCEAHLMERSAQVIKALLTLSTQLQVSP